MKQPARILSEEEALEAAERTAWALQREYDGWRWQAGLQPTLPQYIALTRWQHLARQWGVMG